MSRNTVWVLLGSLLLGVAAAGADEVRAAKIVGIRVGLGGYYKAGLWTPVEVTVGGASRLQGAKVSLTLPDNDGIPSRVFAPLPSPALDAAGGAALSPDERSVLLCARLGRNRSQLTVEVHEQDRVVAQRDFEASDEPGPDHFRPALFSDQDLIVTVGPASVGAEEAVKLLRQKAAERTVVVRLDDLSQLPTKWYGYEGVDAVVLSTTNPKAYADLTPDSPRIAALDEWIRLGGKLVLCVGEHGAEVLARKPEKPDEPSEPNKLEAPLARLAPGRFVKVIPLRQTGALETYCGSVIPVPLGPDADSRGLGVSQLTDVEGTIVAREGNVPLVIERASGFGQIVFVATDLDRAPLDKWSGRGLLVGKLLDYSTTPVQDGVEDKALMHFGYADMAGQLRSALDQFTGVWVIPYSFVIGVIALYLLAIGPGDYFFLRKIVRRMEFTWITFPAIVLVFGVGAYVLADRFKGDQIRVNQVDLIDVDTETGLVRGTAWTNVFSPSTRRYDLRFQPKLLDGSAARGAKVLVGWLGLPGGALGGMNRMTTPPTLRRRDYELWRRHYEFSRELDALSGVPIQVWSTKSITARWSLQSNLGPRAELIEQDQLPQGTITNTLDFPLSECLLAYDQWAYELGTLEPGASIRVGPSLTRRELNSLLTGRKLVFDASEERHRRQATPYDVASVDIPYILRAMMFFNAAGGRRYTRLSNSYQEFVDLSGLLRRNRAVLIAVAPGETSEAGHGGAELVLTPEGKTPAHREERHLTIYRFVFPVEKTNSQ